MLPAPHMVGLGGTAASAPSADWAALLALFMASAAPTAAGAVPCAAGAALLAPFMVATVLLVADQRGEAGAAGVNTGAEEDSAEVAAAAGSRSWRAATFLRGADKSGTGGKRTKALLAPSMPIGKRTAPCSWKVPGRTGRDCSGNSGEAAAGGCRNGILHWSAKRSSSGLMTLHGSGSGSSSAGPNQRVHTGSGAGAAAADSGKWRRQSSAGTGGPAAAAAVMARDSEYEIRAQWRFAWCACRGQHLGHVPLDCPGVFEGQGGVNSTPCVTHARGEGPCVLKLIQCLMHRCMGCWDDGVMGLAAALAWDTHPSLYSTTLLTMLIMRSPSLVMIGRHRSIAALAHQLQRPDWATSWPLAECGTFQMCQQQLPCRDARAHPSSLLVSKTGNVGRASCYQGRWFPI